MSLYSERIFPWILDVTDPPEIDEQRALLLKDLRGDVLEIGLGTGASLRHYPAQVRTLTAVEPIGGMQRRAARRAVEVGREVEMHRLAGETLPFEDGRFDAAVSIFVLCTVDDVSSVLAEAYRVLRPGGRLHFVEHVASRDPRVRIWQNRLNGISRRLSCGCELIRETERAIRDSSFTVETVDHLALKGLIAIYPLIRGTAVKPG